MNQQEVTRILGDFETRAAALPGGFEDRGARIDVLLGLLSLRRMVRKTLGDSESAMATRMKIKDVYGLVVGGLGKANASESSSLGVSSCGFDGLYPGLDFYRH